MTQGTDHARQQVVWGPCMRCPDPDAILYAQNDELVCASCYRRGAVGVKRVQPCDECGTTPAWRDPITRRNEYLCAKCHGARGLVFQNRWARANADSVAQSLPIRSEREKCEVADNSCFGQVKPRAGRVLCDHHAGKPRR